MARSSSGDTPNHYTKVKFWMENPFWENAMYSEKSKEYFRNWVQNMVKNERRDYVLK